MLDRAIIFNWVRDRVKEIRHFALHDVLIPSVKDTRYKIGDSALSIVIYGDAKKKPEQSASSSTSVKSRMAKLRESYLAENTIHVNDLPFPSKERRQDILEQLFEMMSDLDVITQDDYYSLIPMTGGCDNIGWKSLQGAGIYLKDGVWMLRMPPAIKLR